MSFNFQKMKLLLAKLTIFLLPLIFWPVPLRFEQTKMIFFLCTSFLLIILILRSFQKFTYPKGWFLWTVILLISTFLNQGIKIDFIEPSYRNQGFFFFLTLGIWLETFEKFSKKEKKNLSLWIGLVVLVESFLILAQWFLVKLDFPILSYNGRPIGTFGEPNAAAGFLILGLPFLASFPVPFLLLTIIAVLATASKAGIGALIAEGIIYFILKRIKPSKEKLVFFLVTFTVILLGIFLVYKEQKFYPFEDRWVIWKLGLRATLEKPILGYGPEKIIDIYDYQYRKIGLPLEQFIIDRSHNLFLDIILFSGFAGLIFFAKWFLGRFQKIKEKQRIISLAGFLVFSFFQPLGVTHWFILFFLLA